MVAKIKRPRLPRLAAKNTPPPKEPTDEAVMGFFEHLEELRNRLFRAFIALAAGMLISVLFTSQVLQLIESSYSSGTKLLVLSPTEGLTVFLRVALLCGAILASPAITYQLLMFIVPGLMPKERRWVLMSLPATTGLFLFGVVFTWFLLVPAYVNFLVGFQSNVFDNKYTADMYVGFITAVLFWHGVAFETPVVFFVLAKLGIVTYKSMLKMWRFAVLGAAIVAAFITPTVDPLTMIAVTVILIVLYLLSVVLVYVGVREKPQTAA